MSDDPLVRVRQLRSRGAAVVAAAPEAALQRAAEHLRDGFASGDWRYELLAAATRTDPGALPDDAASLWLRLASGVVQPAADPPHPASDDDAYADWHALSTADWVGVVEHIVGAGAGLPADAESLASYAAESAVARGLRGHDVAADALAARFRPAAVLLRALGAIDDEAQLTELGAWGVPEVLERVLADRAAAG